MIDLESIYLDCFESLKYDLIEWCFDVLNDVCNKVKVWSRHSIFRKGNTLLRLLSGCIDLWVSCEWDDPNSIDIMKSHRWNYSVCESRRRSIWLSLRFERTDKSRSNEFTLSYEMMRYWDNYVHGCVDFTMSSMTGVCLWMLISIHESSESRVKCLSMWVSRNLIEVMGMMSVIDTWWLCEMFEKLYENLWILCINLKFKLYKKICYS